jgi:hypothetical protein
MKAVLVLLLCIALLMPLVSAGAGAYLAADPTKGYTKSITLGMVATLDNSTIGMIVRFFVNERSIANQIHFFACIFFSWSNSSLVNPLWLLCLPLSE